MGTVTLANMKLSTVAGTAFVDFSTAGLLIPYLGNLLIITDTSGKSITGYIAAAGTGETYGTELVSNGSMETGNPPTGWGALGTPETFERSDVQKHGGTYSAHVIDSTASYGGFSQNTTQTINLLYKLIFWYYIQSGTILIQLSNGDASANIINMEYSTLGSFTSSTIYYTQTKTGTSSYVYFANGSSSVAGEYYIDDVSVQQVLTPSATGVTITSTTNHDIFNWASIDSGFNYQSATFTYAMEAPPRSHRRARTFIKFDWKQYEYLLKKDPEKMTQGEFEMYRKMQLLKQGRNDY